MILIIGLYDQTQALVKDMQDKDRINCQQKEAFHYQQRKKSTFFNNLNKLIFVSLFKPYQ